MQRSLRVVFAFALILLTSLYVLQPVRAQSRDIFISGGLDQVSRITRDGTVLPFANTGPVFPNGLAFTQDGTLYVANTFSGDVSRIDSAGNVTPFSDPTIDTPGDIVFGPDGFLYVAGFGNPGVTPGSVSRVDSAGHVTTFVSGNGLVGTYGLAFDATGNLYTGNSDNVIRKIDPLGNITDFASGGGLDLPADLAFGPDGFLYVANTGAVPGTPGSISKISPGGVVTPFVTGLDTPTGLLFDVDGTLYVTSIFGGTIDKIDAAGSVTPYASGLTFPRLMAFAVPEPGSLAMFAGLVSFGIGFRMLRKRGKKSAA